MFRLTASTFVFIALASCASTAPTSNYAGPKRVSGSAPQIGELSTTRVGNELYETYNYVEKTIPEQAILSTPVRTRLGLLVRSMPAETKLSMKDNGRACAHVNYNDGLSCLEDQDGDGNYERFGVRPSLIWFWGNLKEPAIVDIRPKRKVIADAGGYKHELVYQGIDGDTLRVQYREYKDNLARPAFTQDLTYPVANGKSEITFRDIQISVEEIRSGEIDYTVTSGATEVVY